MNTLLFFGVTSLLASNTGNSYDGIKAVEVENGSGRVNVRPSADGKANVAYKIRSGEDCRVDVEQKGARLLVSVLSDCEVDLSLEVPRAVALSLSTGSGDIRVRGVRGELRVRTGSGDIDADAEIVSAEVKTGSGDLRLLGLLGAARVKTGSGDVHVRYVQAPKSGALDVKTGSGDVLVSFPKGSAVRADFLAGSGELTDRLGLKGNAEFVVRARSGSGDLLVLAE